MYTTKDLITVEQLAENLGITRQTAYNMTKAEGFPHIKIGRYIKVIESEVNDWLKENRESGWRAWK